MKFKIYNLNIWWYGLKEWFLGLELRIDWKGNEVSFQEDGSIIYLYLGAGNME